MGAKKYFLNGKKIHNLEVISCIRGLCDCVCKCGEKRRIAAKHLAEGRYKSCGCMSNPHRKEYVSNFKKAFWERVIFLPNGCKEWLGNKRCGYGRIGFQGKLISCHRLVWEWENGEIPEGMVICHKCDNPSCLNIDHLFLGTQSDNMRDCVNKKRRRDRKGKKNGNAKLSHENVMEIFRLLELGLTQKIIASKFNVTEPTIGRIKRRENWGHI